MKNLLLILLLYSLKLFGAFESFSQDPFTGGLSNSVIVSENFYSTFLLNPAATAQMNSINLGLMYFKPYSISELNNAIIISNFNIKNFGAGLSISTFGNSIYQENQLTLNLSRPLFIDRFCLGLNLSFYNIRIENYPNLSTYGLDLGIIYIANDFFQTGFAIKNINQPNLSEHTEEIPLITKWGAAFKLEERINAYISIEKDSWFAPCLSFGFEFKTGEFLSIQSGYMTYPSMPSIGFILSKNWINFHYGFQYHFELGGTHLWGITFSRKKQ
jgi:hypothetical protein